MYRTFHLLKLSMRCHRGTRYRALKINRDISVRRWLLEDWLAVIREMQCLAVPNEIDVTLRWHLLVFTCQSGQFKVQNPDYRCAGYFKIAPVRKVLNCFSAVESLATGDGWRFRHCSHAPVFSFCKYFKFKLSASSTDFTFANVNKPSDPTYRLKTSIVNVSGVQ